MSTHFDRASLLSERGQHADAVREYLAHLANDPDNGYAHGLLALELAKLSQFDDGLAHAAESLRTIPDGSFPLFVMGQIEQGRRNFAEAAEWINKALRIDPEKHSYWQSLASIRALEGKLADALKAIERCLELDPENIACLNLRASIFLQKGNDFDAAEVSREVLRLNPENSMAHIVRSSWMMRRGALDNAIASIEEGLRLDPDSDYGRVALLYAVKLKIEWIAMLMGLNYLAWIIAPLLLLFAAWIYHTAMKSPEYSPPASEIDYAIFWGLYGASLLIAFVCPVTDVFMTLFHRVGNSISQSARNVGIQLTGIGACYWLLFGAVLYFPSTRQFWGGFVLLLPANLPALRYYEIKDNKWRRVMTLAILLAPAAVFAPALLWIFTSLLGGTPPLQNEHLAYYEVAVAVLLMALFYWLSWKEQKAA